MIMDYVMHYWDGLALLGITMMMAKIVEVFGGYELYDYGLCNALLGWTGPAGYNHRDDQSGSNEDGYYSTDGSWIADA